MRQPVLSPVAPPLFPNGRDQSEPLAASWHPSARAKRTQSLSAAHETNVPVWLLGWSNRFLPALAAREPGLDPKQRRLTLDDQVIEDDDASLALVREQAGRPLGLIASSTAAAPPLPSLAWRASCPTMANTATSHSPEPVNRLKGQWPAGESALRV
jgi:hypothetical protein